MELAGRTLLGKYRIEKMLGRGGMGSVWKGVHAGTGRPVAVKLLDERLAESPSIVERFGREARAASAIHHTGIVEVMDLDRTEEGLPFLVMEFLDGQSLSAYLEAKVRLTEKELAELADQLLDALEAAHEKGVVHRDLKPDNIFLVPARKGYRLKILDFGISSKADESAQKLTATGSLLGTPHYVSPEQANGEPNLDRRSDLYSCAVLFYECVVGQVPFDAPSLPRLLLDITMSDPVPPRERGAMISEAMEAVLLKTLQKKRDDRPATASQLRDLVLAAAEGTLQAIDVTLDGVSLKATLAARRATSAPTHDGAKEAAATAPAHARPSSGPDEPSGNAPYRPGTLSGAQEPAAPAAKPKRAAPVASSPASISGLEGLDDLGPRKRLEVDKDALAVAKRAVDATSPRKHVAPVERARAAEPEGTNWTRVAVVAVLMAGVAGGGALLAVDPALRARLVGSSPVEVPFVAPAVAPDAGPDWVVVHLEDLPAGASVTLDGLPVADGSLRVRRGTTCSVRIRADGFVERTLEVEGEEDGAVSGALEPLPVPEPTPARRRRPPR